MITVVIEGVWLFEFLMLVALAISHLLMPVIKVVCWFEPFCNVQVFENIFWPI
jgi:hypothetical protein